MKKLSKEIWIVAAKRTAFGAMSGSLEGHQRHRPRGARVEGRARAERARGERDSTTSIFGNVQQTSPDAIYGARHVGLKSGLPIEVPALTVNRLCGSGFQAVVNAAEQILLGDAKAVLAAGTENMSQAPHASGACATARKLRQAAGRWSTRSGPR